MKQVAKYFMYQFRQQTFIIAVLQLLPVAIPYIMFFIMISFLKTAEDIDVVPASVPFLPQLNHIGYQGILQNATSKPFDNFVYFAYQPVNNYTTNIVNQLMKLNNLINSSRTRGFNSEAEMEKYISMKNILPQYRSRYHLMENVSDPDQIDFNGLLCQDLKSITHQKNCYINLSLTGPKVLENIYNISELDQQDFVKNPLKFADDIFFAINFYIDGDFNNISNITNVTYEIIYNTTILDETIKEYPDDLSRQFGNIKRAPIWTGYTFTLQKQLDEITVKKLTNLNYTIQFSRQTEMDKITCAVINFFELTIAISWTITFVLSIILGSVNRGSNQLILRRLGVKEWQFWVCNAVFTWVPTFLSLQIQGAVWHFAGNAIFMQVSYPFVIFQMLMLSLIFSAVSLISSSIIGNSYFGSVIFSCLSGFFFIIIPTIFHISIFNGESFYDPSLVPQWAIWVAQIVFPPLQTMSVLDSFTSVLGDRYLAINRYNFKIYQQQVPIDYIFKDYKRYTSIPRICKKPDSTVSNVDPNKCMYYQPLYGYTTIMHLLENLFLVILTLIIQYMKSEPGYRGISFKSIFSKIVWCRNKIEAKGQLSIRNLQISYPKQISCKKQIISGFKQFAKQRDIVLKNIDYSLQNGQISALVAESSSGKSTTLKFIAGELNPCSIQGNPVTCVDSPNMLTNHNYLLNDATQEEVHQFFDSQCEKVTTIFDSFDLANSTDATVIKSYIGFCPQDFSNVWMEMSCFQNVCFSYLIRTYNQGYNIPKNYDDIIVQQLKQLGLGENKVMKSKAKHLSGGMLRRLALCNSLIGNPKILLLDEVSAGVDPVLKRMIWNVIKKLSEDVSVVMTTHDMSEISEIAQRITIIDKGFKIVTDETPFNLRINNQKYSIKFYYQDAVCSFDKANQIIDQLQCVSNQENFVVDAVSPHMLRIIILKGINNENIQLLAHKLEEIKTSMGFQDYIISKAKLEDIYIDLIGYQRITEQSQSKVNLNEVIVPNLQSTNEKLSRVKYLLKIFYYRDFHTKIPLIFWLCSICIIMAMISFWFKIVIDSVLGNVDESDAQNFNRKKSGIPCLVGCLTHYHFSNDSIGKCFTERPYKLFQFRNLEANDKPSGKCGTYMTYLGLDVQEPHYVAIGDRRYQHKQNFQSFGVRDQYQYQQSYKFEQVNQDQQQVSMINSSVLIDNIHVNNKPQGDNILFKNFEPSYLLVNPDRSGKCYDVCANLSEQFGICLESFNKEQCLKHCDSIVNEKEMLVSMPNIVGFRSIAEYLDTIHSHVSLNFDSQPQIEYYYNQYQYLLNRSQVASQFTLLGFIDIVKENYSIISNQLYGNLSINYSTLMPNRGTINSFYFQNFFLHRSINKSEYYCNGLWLNTSNDVWEAIPGQHKHDMSLSYQSRPEKESVTLFDIANQPLTQLTGSILRIAKGQHDIFYSIASRQMTKFSELHVTKLSSINTNDILTMISNLQLTVTGLLPMLYAGFNVGLEIEQNLPRLLKLHFTGASTWILSSLLYYLLISLLPMLTNLISMMIFVPDAFFKSSYTVLNIFFFAIECFEGIPTGIFIAIISKKGKLTAIFCFFIILFALIFNILSFGNSTFTYIVMLFLPSYGQYYQIFLSSSKAEADWFVFVTSIVITFVYIGLINIILNFDQLVSRWRSYQCKSNPSNEENQSLIMINDIEQFQNQEMIIKNIDMTYNNGTNALKSINLVIPKGQIFGLLGSNGSGKSTLIHCLAGVFVPQKGEAILVKKQINLLQQSQKSNFFSIVPQHDIYWSNITVKEHIQLIQGLNAQLESLSEDFLLQVFELQDYADQRADQLSGGMKRRLSIALALTNLPDILSLDEPSTGLGLTTKRQVHQAILRVLQNRETTLVLTSHDMDEVESLVDCCCIMYQGKVLKTGSISQLRQSCSVQFELSLKLNSDLQKDLLLNALNGCDIISCRYNKFVDTYILQVGRKCSMQLIIKTLQETGFIELPWILDVVQMENVFMEVIHSKEEESAKL